MQIVPPVKYLKITSEVWKRPFELKVFYTSDLLFSYLELKRWTKVIKSVQKEAEILFEKHPSFNEEQYSLSIHPKGVHIKYGSPSGAFYAVKTLKQLFLEYPNEIPCMEIHDEPELKVRGYMLDISRDKIPTLSTIFHLVDILADLKYNHFELYVEGFSFLYPSFQSLYRDETPMTIEDYQQIENYCKQRMIDFVPCHNSFGHMSAWLARPMFQSLAIIPEGMVMWGAHRPASTLNPLDPKSFELVEKYYQDVLSISTSSNFNINMDEPYELGVGKTKEAAQRLGVGTLYFDYFMKVYHLVKRYGKTPMMWGDVWKNHPEQLEKLPKDVRVIDWGYDMNYPFKETLRQLLEHHQPFLASPGTSSWNSITGRTEDMLETIHQACFWTKHYRGEGVLLTDWGDNGHLQVLTISIPAIVYLAMESWSSSSGHYQSMVEYLNQVIFKDSTHQLAAILLDLGRYNQFQSHYRFNATFIMDPIWAALEAKKQADPLVQYRKALLSHEFMDLPRTNNLIKLLDLFHQRIQLTELKCTQNKLIKKELSWSIQLVKVLTLSITILNENLTSKEHSKIGSFLNKQWPKILASHSKLWLKRNRRGGMDHSATYLKNVYELVKMVL